MAYARAASIHDKCTHTFVKRRAVVEQYVVLHYCCMLIVRTIFKLMAAVYKYVRESDSLREVLNSIGWLKLMVLS